MKELLPHEEYRRDSYKLLSECYYLPDEKLIEMLNGLGESGGRLYSEIAGSAPGISELESLKIDYSKLFVGPYGLLASPYGSTYLEDTSRVMGNSTMDVRHKYAAEGLDICLKEAPDHIAIELEFIYFLIHKEVEAIGLSDSVAAAGYRQKQRAFLETHLGEWVAEFASKVEASARTGFYKNLGRLTRSFVEQDLEGLAAIKIWDGSDVLKAG